VGIEALKDVIPEKSVMFTFGGDVDVEQYTIKNKNGVDATFAIGTFRNGFDLWLMDIEGHAIRV